MSTEAPLLIEPRELAQMLRGDEPPLVVHVGNPESHTHGHVPGAVFLPYEALTRDEPPVSGLVPDDETLGQILSGIGLTPDRHIVAYDADNGGRAARLLYTLAIAGHDRMSMLNGGLTAWVNEAYPIERELVTAQVSHYRVKRDDSHIADRDYILAHLEDPEVVILDVRSADEYSGRDLKAKRGGHIPGAVHMEWTRAIDKSRHLRMRPFKELQATLASLGVTPDREIIVYCQTHHRSAHTWALLKASGFERVRGYPGAWSDWGNQPDTPIEIDESSR